MQDFIVKIEFSFRVVAETAEEAAETIRTSFAEAPDTILPAATNVQITSDPEVGDQQPEPEHQAAPAISAPAKNPRPERNTTEEIDEEVEPFEDLMEPADPEVFDLPPLPPPAPKPAAPAKKSRKSRR